jgi:hypothetical protein
MSGKSSFDHATTSTDLRAMQNAAIAAHQMNLSADERRGETRWPYAVRQLVAFHEQSQTPGREMFHAVRCRDISVSGISFYYSGPPASDYCSFVLGRAPNLLYVRAQVIHYGPYAGESNEWVIGCRFLTKQPLAVSHVADAAAQSGA